MGKHSDKLGKFEDFKAPWETEAGDDAEIDKPKLKRLIFNLKAGEAKALDAQDEAKETISTLEKERDEAKEEAEKASPDEANRKISRLESERDDLKKWKADREAADEHDALRKEVIGDLDPKYAKYVTGETREDLEKSLEAVKEDFNLEASKDEDEDEEGEEDDVVRTRPQTRLKTGRSKDGAGADQEVDFDKAADQILGGSIFA